MKKKIWNQKGSSMLLMVCIFLVLAVLGINLLNAANSNVSNTRFEYEKEQTMLYVTSVYEIVNGMIEDGSFSDAAGTLSDGAVTMDNQGFQDSRQNDIRVEVKFFTDTLPIRAEAAIGIINSSGKIETYTIVGTYSKAGVIGNYVRESCKGVSDDVSNP